MPEYYDGTKLLSLLDLNKRKPEIYMATTNKTGGKTTYFSRLLVNRFIKQKAKFMLIYRFSYELADCASKFFDDIQRLFFPSYSLDAVSCSKGLYYKLMLNGENCGYAVALNTADKLKTCSHVFSDTSAMFMDEFQSETGRYCPKEIQKFHTLHTAVARGNGEHVRYVPLYMCANPVTMLNPYYSAFGIGERLNNKTKFLRGNGWVLEQGYVESAAEAQLTSGFNAAFSGSRVLAYSAQGVYLNDSEAFIEKPLGKSRYLCTIRFENIEYAIREFTNMGIIYCDNRPDNSFPLKISVTTLDHDINYVMLKRYANIIKLFRFYFDKGCFRFRNANCKNAIITALAYH
jgi:hypothetical protein